MATAEIFKQEERTVKVKASTLAIEGTSEESSGASPKITKE